MRNKLLLFVFCLILKPSISYSLVEIDYNEWSNDTQAAEILYERIEEEFGEYVEDDYEADIEFETYGDYEGNFYDKEEMDKLVAVKGWVD